MTNLADLSARELAKGYAENRFSPVEVMQAVLDRCNEKRELNAFVTLTPDAALDAARKAEARQLRGDILPPLHGIPYSVKDLTLTAGVPTTMGSLLMKDNVPDHDAVAVARAKAAGAILIGKTNTPEFGHKIHTDNLLTGRTLNPHNPEVTAGGSSGGAAVAVATGQGPIALGTDGGGSVRIPSSCCGTVGLKPTLGVIPNLQAADLFASNVHVAPMAQNVGDTRLLFDAVRGFDRHDPYGQAQLPPSRRCQSLKGLRIAWLPTAGNPLDHQVETLCEGAVERLAEAGAVVELVDLNLAALEPHFLVMLETLLANRVGDKLDSARELLDPSLVTHAMRGREHSALALAASGAARSRAFADLQRLLEQFDVIASPTLSAPPLPHSQDPHQPVVINNRLAGLVRASWYPYTFVTNMTGHPSISVPCAWDARGLPVGFHMITSWYQEDFLLDIAALAENLFGFDLSEAPASRR